MRKACNLFIGIMFLINLTACASSGKSSSFSCPAPRGMGCKSISELDEMLDKREGVIRDHNSVAAQSVSYNPSDERTGEKILNVWMAPFVDREGIYHTEQNLKIVVKPAEWQNKREY